MTEVESRLASLLRADISEAEARLAELRSEAAATQAEIATLERRVEQESALLAERFGAAGESAARVAEQPDFATLSISRGAILVLREAGRPMHVREIVEELQRRGKMFSGKTPHRSMSAILHQSDEVTFLEKNRFEAKPQATESEGAK